MPFPSPGDLPNPVIEPRSPALQADSLPSEPPVKPENTGVGSLSLLQGIFPTQELNRGLLHGRWILYQLSYQGRPYCKLDQWFSPKVFFSCLLAVKYISPCFCSASLETKHPMLPHSPSFQDFPDGSDGKESACNAGDPGSIPGLGRFPGEGNGNPLQYSCLENSMNFYTVLYFT